MKKTVFLFMVFLLLSVCTAAAAERLSVSTPVANIRSGPGTENAIIWKVEKYHPLLVIEKDGPWCFFQDFEGDMGWIHQSLLKKTPTVITKARKCNVRAGAGTQFDILFTLGKGVPFKVIGRKGKWLHVQHADGDRGWIHRSLVW